MTRTSMERFSPSARKALSYAQEEAERRRHPAVDTAHLLLGLVYEELGVAGRVLREFGLSLLQVGEAIEHLTPSGQAEAEPRRLDLSPQAKKTLELAVGEARRLHHHQIRTEHLLLGLIRLEEGGALDVLQELGINLKQIRRQTQQLLADQSPATPRQPAPRERASFQAHDGPIRVMAFSLDGRLLATAAEEDGTVKVWLLTEGREIASLTGHNVPVHSIVFSLAGLGHVLAVGSQDGTVKVWSLY